jgi:hypothetical protein
MNAAVIEMSLSGGLAMSGFDVRMNRMDPDTKAAHLRLEEWGKWAKDAETRAWPNRTLLGRVIDEGFGAGQSTRPPIHMPPEVATVDAAVCRLGAIDRLVILTYYVRWEPIEVMARRSHMRVRQFQNVLRRARWRICGYLDAAETKGLNASS